MNFTPKYYQISQKIIKQITHGELAPGMRLPSENEIIQKYDVSNTTARRILNDLSSGGWATRIKGKGTYVRAENIHRKATRILSFSKNMIEAGYKPGTRLLKAKSIKTGYKANINGRNYSIQGPVYMIHRLRFANDIPMMVEKRYISTRLCPAIEQQNFEGSLYELYTHIYDLHLIEIRQMLSAFIIAEKEMQKSIFNVDEPIPAFLVDGVTFCARDTVLEMEQSIYRADKYRFSVQAT